MPVGQRVGQETARARAIFERRPSAAQAAKAATARVLAEGWQTEVQMGAHRLLVDQPEALGGAETGPSPGDLIRAALAACLAQEYAMQAPRFDVVLHGIEVTVETEIDLRPAWGIETGNPPGFSAMRYSATLTTDAVPERVQALVDYVDGRSPSLDDLRRTLDVRGGLTITPVSTLTR
jgi:uncharacterized OsmC-like protein